MLLHQQSYAIKNQLVALFFCLLLAGSLWHKDSWLPFTERFYYGIILLGKQFLGTVLDMEVEQSACQVLGEMTCSSCLQSKE